MSSPQLQLMSSHTYQHVSASFMPLAGYHGPGQVKASSASLASTFTATMMRRLAWILLASTLSLSIYIIVLHSAPPSNPAQVQSDLHDAPELSVSEPLGIARQDWSLRPGLYDWQGRPAAPQPGNVRSMAVPPDSAIFLVPLAPGHFQHAAQFIAPQFTSCRGLPNVHLAMGFSTYAHRDD